MSKWTTFRNSIEAIFDPEIAAATTFGQAVFSDTEAAAGGNITSSFDDAVMAFEVPGTLETRLIAAVTVFATKMLGYEVAIIKKELSNA